MSALAIMIPISLILGIGFLGAFLWATSRGQFDDLTTPANEILIDDINNGDNKDG